MGVEDVLQLLAAGLEITTPIGISGLAVDRQLHPGWTQTTQEDLWMQCSAPPNNNNTHRRGDWIMGGETGWGLTEEPHRRS
ncbi:hypothetical protein VTI74DRAFT_9027 [Chaetomium olivicolor]